MENRQPSPPNSKGLTLTEATYARVRNDILLGVCRPGEKLKLDAMRDLYGASINTLREILSRLISEGLVMSRGQGGFVVVPVSLADLRDITEMRLLLECRAARLSIEHADLEWESSLVAAYHKLSRAEEMVEKSPEKHSELYETYNREFHHALVAGCQSRWLLTFHSVMYDQSTRYRMLSFRVQDFPRDQSRREHREILDAALAHDAAQLEKVLTAHITKGAELYHEDDLKETKPRKRRGPQRNRGGSAR